MAENITKVESEEELGKALKNNSDEIEITGDLARKVIKIKAKGKVAWAVAIGAIAVAIASIIIEVSSAGTSSVVTVPTALLSGSSAVAVLGLATAISAVKIGVAFGGKEGLEILRKTYRIVSQKNNHVILKRK